MDTLGLSNPKSVESNLDRANIYYASHTRPDKGDEKLDSVLEPICSVLITIVTIMYYYQHQ